MPAKSETLSFTVPKTLRMELSAIPETGYYDSVSEFLRDAMRTVLSARKDVRIAVATVLYDKGEISFGKAVEIADVSYEEMKSILSDRKIKIRRGAETREILNREAKNLS